MQPTSHAELTSRWCGDDGGLHRTPYRGRFREVSERRKEHAGTSPNCMAGESLRYRAKVAQRRSGQRRSSERKAAMAWGASSRPPPLSTVKAPTNERHRPIASCLSRRERLRPVRNRVASRLPAGVVVQVDWVLNEQAGQPCFPEVEQRAGLAVPPTRHGTATSLALDEVLSVGSPRPWSTPVVTPDEVVGQRRTFIDDTPPSRSGDEPTSHAAAR